MCNNSLSMEQKQEMILKCRSFQRSYSRQLGLLNLRVDKNIPFSLISVRIVMEIDQQPGCTAAHISKHLLLDRAAVSRTLQQLIKAGYVERTSTSNDMRSYNLYLTDSGKAFLESANTHNDNLFQTRLIDKLTPDAAVRLTELLEEADAIIRNISD